MARECPSCGRPNSDAAQRCLYCVAPLPPEEPPSPAADAPASSTEASDRHLLILIPGEEPDEDRTRELSRVTGVSAYEARLSLSSRRPRLVRRLSTESEARGLSRELARCAIAHYVVSEAAVTSLPVAAASGLSLHDHRLEIRLDAAGASPLSVGLADVLLLVRGEITRERHDEKRLGSTRSASWPLTPGLRLHLYPREAPMALEVDPERFDFGVLGAEQTSSAYLNFDRLIARLAAAMPGAELDRGFDQEPAVPSRASGGELTSVLVQSDRGPEGVLYDNEAQFRFYARWRYRLARHLASASSG